MIFRDLTLCKRLVLALVPGVVIVAPMIIAHVSVGYQYPLNELTAALVYCALFGGFVMVPFVSARSRVALRSSALIIFAPAAVYFVTLYLSLVESLTNGWSIGETLILIVVFVAVFFFNLLNSLLLAIAAPLATNRRFWGVIGLAGAATGVLAAALFHYFFCMIWCDWTLLLLNIPLFVWPLLFCTTVYLWRRRQGERLRVDNGS